jgi:hypothetical protein
MIKAMPSKSHVVAWTALLGTYRRSDSYVEMGCCVAKKVLELKLEVMLAMCCYQIVMLLLATTISMRILNGRERKKRSVKKQLGCTWIKLNNEMPTFVVDDQGP